MAIANLFGIQPETCDIRVTSRCGAAITAGSVVQLDLGSTATEALSTNFRPGTADGPLTTIVDPVAGDVDTVGFRYGIFAIALEDIADNADGMVRLRGYVGNANVDGATVPGAGLIAAANNQLDIAVGTSAAKVIGIALQTDASSVAAIIFNGVEGFGTCQT